MPRTLVTATALLLALGCTKNHTPQPAPMPSAPTAPMAPEAPEAPEAPVAEPPTQVPAGLAADGGACVTATDCQSGICEGVGCGDDPAGVCAPVSRSCTRDARAYCGCDDVSFRTSGSCPGRRYQARGPCPGG